MDTREFFKAGLKLMGLYFMVYGLIGILSAINTMLSIQGGSQFYKDTYLVQARISVGTPIIFLVFSFVFLFCSSWVTKILIPSTMK